MRGKSRGSRRGACGERDFCAANRRLSGERLELSGRKIRVCRPGEMVVVQSVLIVITQCEKFAGGRQSRNIQDRQVAVVHGHLLRCCAIKLQRVLADVLWVIAGRVTH